MGMTKLALLGSATQREAMILQTLRYEGENACMVVCNSVYIQQ
jgi:hypothetical protein